MYYKFNYYQQHNQVYIRQLILVQMFYREYREKIDRNIALIDRMFEPSITRFHNLSSQSTSCFIAMLLFYFVYYLLTFYFIFIISRLHFFPYFKRFHLSSSHFSTVTIVLLSHSRASAVFPISEWCVPSNWCYLSFHFTYLLSNHPRHWQTNQLSFLMTKYLCLFSYSLINSSIKIKLLL